MAVFRFFQKVKFHHCDPAGIVFYPRYYEMLNACVEAWFDEQLDYDFVQMIDIDGKGVPTVRQTSEFRLPSRHGDILLFSLVPAKIGNSSVDIRVTVTCNRETRIFFTTRLVFFSNKTGKSEHWPPAVRKKIETDLESQQDA